MPARMDVTFVLPPLKPYPSGGFLIVYQHALHLAARGHRARVLHLALPMDAGSIARRNPWWRLVYMGLQPHRVWRWLRRNRGPQTPPASVRPPWFSLPDAVESLEVSPLHMPGLVEGAHTTFVATSPETAFHVHNLPTCRKFYFIQDWEAWAGNNERAVVLSWALPLRKLVISRWLRQWAALLGDPSAIIIPNALDPGFSCPNPPEDRDARSVLFYANPSSRKDWRTARQVLERVSKMPDVRIGLLSATSPESLPKQVRPYICPPRTELAEIYGRHAIFVHTSFIEGWGLPPMEALACGCACAMTDSLGVREFLDEGHLERLRPPGDVAGLTAQIEAWLADPEARSKAARKGRDAVSAFTWKHSADLMEKALSGNPQACDGLESGDV